MFTTHHSLSLWLPIPSNRIVYISVAGVQSQIRGAIKEAFVRNGLPYHHPHTFRHSIARKMKQGENATARLIALAENFGHKGGMSTLVASYGGDYLCERAGILKEWGME
jgi:integrase